MFHERPPTSSEAPPSSRKPGAGRRIAAASRGGALAATDAPKTWDAAGAANPDFDLANQVVIAGDRSGVRPTSSLWGMGASLLRMQTYGATNTHSDDVEVMRLVNKAVCEIPEDLWKAIHMATAMVPSANEVKYIYSSIETNAVA